MKFIHIRGGPMIVLMVVMALVFCISIAGADQSANISQSAILVNDVMGFDVISDLNTAFADGTAVSQNTTTLSGNTVAIASDAVGVSYSFAADKMTQNAAMVYQNPFITTTVTQGALLPGSTLVVQWFANTTGINVGVDIGNRFGRLQAA